MLHWQKVHSLLLLTVFSAVLFVFGKSTFYPAQPQEETHSFAFPEAVPLPEWQFLSSEPLAEQIAVHRQLISAQEYHYSKDHVPLQIAMHYLINTDGDVLNFFEKYTSITVPSGQQILIKRKYKSVGTYSVFTDQRRAHLSTCINPYGGSTVTDREFKYQRNFHDIRNRLLPWLLGEELKDERCLWVHLVIPIQGGSVESTYQILEAVWLSWYRWWHHHFPEA